MVRDIGPRPEAMGLTRSGETQKDSSALDQAFSVLEDALAGFKDYVVFGSSALYLRQKKAGENTEILSPPDDIDIACKDVQILEKLRDRLRKHEAITLYNDGEFQSFPGQPEARFFSGSIETRGQIIPFECFSEGRMVNREIFKQHSRVGDVGLNVLTGEGLQNQYGKNLAFEKRVEAEVMRVARELAADKKLKKIIMGSNRNSGYLAGVLKKYDLVQEDLEAFFGQLESYGGDVEAMLSHEEVRKKLAMAFAGYKTKISARQKKLALLHGEPVDIGDENKKEEETLEDLPPLRIKHPRSNESQPNV